MGVRRGVRHTHPSVAFTLTGLVSLLIRDMALTGYEVEGPLPGLLESPKAPIGMTRLADWLDDNADGLSLRTCVGTAA